MWDAKISNSSNFSEKPLHHKNKQNEINDTALRYTTSAEMVLASLSYNYVSVWVGLKIKNPGRSDKEVSTEI